MRPAGQVVLVVDDDASMLHIAEVMLRHRGYETIAAPGPLEALKKSNEFRGEIHLLLTDVMMPEMDGLALAQRVLSERVHIRARR